MLNRRGHIPTLLLFVEALILVIAAWIAFLSMGGGVDAQAHNIDLLVNNLNVNDLYVHEIFPLLVQRAITRADSSNFEASFCQELVKASDAIVTVRVSDTNFFGKIRNNCKVVSEGALYKLELNDVFVHYGVGDSAITRTFNMAVRFDKKEVKEDL